MRHGALLDFRASHQAQDIYEGRMGEGPIAVAYPSFEIQGQTGSSHLVWASGPSGLYAPVTQKRTRARRVDRLRSITLSGKLKEWEYATPSELEDLDLEDRPRTRADCIDAQRPCPWVSCKHHLYIEVNPVTGSVQLPFGHLDIDEIPQSCSLDAAALGPFTLEEVGGFTNRTKERIRQIEVRAQVVLRGGPSMVGQALADWIGLGEY